MRFSKFSVLTLMAVSMSISTRAQSSQQEQQTMDQFIQGLMDKMTLEEKIGQLNPPATLPTAADKSCRTLPPPSKPEK